MSNDPVVPGLRGNPDAVSRKGNPPGLAVVPRETDRRAELPDAEEQLDPTIVQETRSVAAEIPEPQARLNVNSGTPRGLMVAAILMTVIVVALVFGFSGE